MTQSDLFNQLKQGLIDLIEENQLENRMVTITCKLLTPQEAIGITERKDFPILTGKEVMLNVEYDGENGQAFTSAPSVGQQTLKEILSLDIEHNAYDRSVFIATLNAVMKKLNKAGHTIHCKNKEPELCAGEVVRYIRENYGNPKVALIGYQPAMLDQLSKQFQVRVLDLSPENVGQIRYGIGVEDGIIAYNSTVAWADVILCTGSTLCNGSIVNFINIGKEVVFYGTTAAGAVELLELKRVCFYSA